MIGLLTTKALALQRMDIACGLIKGTKDAQYDGDFSDDLKIAISRAEDYADEAQRLLLDELNAMASIDRGQS